MGRVHPHLIRLRTVPVVDDFDRSAVVRWRTRGSSLRS